jgi:hypothetical protein
MYPAPLRFEWEGAACLNPNAPEPNRQKPLRSRDSSPSEAALDRELGPNGARLGQDSTYGQVRLDLSEPMGSHI